MFAVPESSSPFPATPDPRSRKPANLFSHSHPSTTPAGPPPASLSNPSTTPAGPPPSSFYGSNRYGSSFTSRTPSRSQHNTSRGSPSKFRASRADKARHGAGDGDMDVNDFDVSIQSADDRMGSAFEEAQIPQIAQSLARRPAPLREPGDVLLATDQLLESLYSFEQEKGVAGSQSDGALAEAVQSLLRVWKAAPDSNIEVIGIGPGDAASDMSKAIFLTSLLLNLHHPARLHPYQTEPRGSQRIRVKPIPEVLVDWLQEFHNQFPEEYTEVMNLEGGPAASEKYWDTVMSLSVRGRITEALNLLKQADFRYAASALEDGADAPGYSGRQLGNIQRVVNRAISVLETCPAIQTGDWDVKGADWAVYRKRIRQTLSDLETFAEGATFEPEAMPFEAENFGVSTSSRGEMSISTMSQRATSRIPWSIYEPLKLIYAQVLGQQEAIVSSSADWVEAAVATAAWWDGSDDTERKKKLAANNFGRSQQTRTVDVRPVSAYQEKLMTALRQITSRANEEELQVNTTSLIEVGLACIFEGDVRGLLGILRGWSTVVSTAVVEVAHFGGWLNESPVPSKRLMEAFDQSDLMVLSVAKPEETTINRDEEMVKYAHMLGNRDKITSRNLGPELHGWEAAIQVLGRLDDERLANQEIANIIQSLELDERRIERVMELCNDLDLPELARSMSEQYADELTANNTTYGSAMYYYARAHSTTKLRKLLNTLISTMLVQSRAYPPISALSSDPVLSSLVTAPASVLSELGFVDGAAAELLSLQFGGYASLRKFYDLRDVDVLQPRSGPQPRSQQSTVHATPRNREALKHLVAAIMSAADSIHGGLYDTSIHSVIPVEGLLVLLGETLPFIDRPHRILSTAQIFTLLKAIEDVETVSGNVYEQCEELFRSARSAVKGGKVASAKELLKKSLSLSDFDGEFGGESAFTAVSFAMSNSSDSVNLVEGEATESEVKRAWDWRRGLEKTTEAKEMLQILRLGLAREVARAWTE